MVAGFTVAEVPVDVDTVVGVDLVVDLDPTEVEDVDGVANSPTEEGCSWDEVAEVVEVGNTTVIVGVDNVGVTVAVAVDCGAGDDDGAADVGGRGI